MAAPDLVGATHQLRDDLVHAVGGDCTVVDDPALVAPQVATDGVCLFLGLFNELTPAALDSYWMTTAVAVVLPSPFGPGQRDRGYRVLARLIDEFDVIGSPRPGDVDLGEIRMPAIVLDIRTRTTCITT